MDLAAPQRLAGLSHLVAGREQGDQELAPHRDFDEAKCCEQAEIGRPQPLARAESTRTQGYVLAGATGVSTALDTGPDGDAVTLALAILLHDHHVGAFRQHRASEDARRHALRQASRRIVTGGNTVD